MANSLAISTTGSERATVGDGNKIVTADGVTHVVWQDIGRDGYLNRIRSLDSATASWTEPVTLGRGIDNHARPVLTVDGDGYLHVVLGGHGSPVTWRRSLRPGDSSEWTPPEPIGEGTYPVLLCGPDNTLYLTLRANCHAGVDFYGKPRGESWECRSRIVENALEYSSAYAAFHMQMMLGPDGVLHAVVDFYEGEDAAGRGLHMAVTYCRSSDGGHNWTRADGTPFATPGRPEVMDTLARSTESRVEKLPRVEDANCGLVVDSQSRPTILHISHRRAPGELHLVALDGAGEPQRQPLQVALARHWPDLRVTDAKATIGPDDAIWVLATLSPLNDEWIRGRPSRAMALTERNDQRLVWIATRDRGATCQVQTAIEPGRAFNAPNPELPVGANVLDGHQPPRFVYFDGTRGYPGGGDYYEKPVEEYLRLGEYTANGVYLQM